VPKRTPDFFDADKCCLISQQVSGFPHGPHFVLDSDAVSILQELTEDFVDKVELSLVELQAFLL
jgi:hypothetical protein